VDAVFGNLEQFGAEVIYPYRWWFAAATVLALTATLFVAYRRRWDRFVWAHRLLAVAVAVPVLAVGIPGGYYVLSPLWDRTTLIEASVDFDRSALTSAGIATPTPAAAATEPPAGATAPPSSPTAASQPAAGPQAELVAFGTWSGSDEFHFAEGEVLIIEESPGRFILRVENFSVRNGPDLFVYLSPAADGYDAAAINLGVLKATDGAFNYEIPADVDVSQFKSAIVWCKRFSVLFATAPLTLVAD
jgi:Electron transfer DM13